MSGSYLLPNFTPFRSSGGICNPSKDYHSMIGHQKTYTHEKNLDNAFMEKNDGKAYSTMMGGKKKKSTKKKSGSKKKTTKKKSTKRKVKK